MALARRLRARSWPHFRHARRLRASGRIPAVVYGTEKGKATEISVDPKMLLRILHSEAGVNSLIGLQLDGSADTRVLVKEGFVVLPYTNDDPVTAKKLERVGIFLLRHQARPR